MAEPALRPHSVEFVVVRDPAGCVCAMDTLRRRSACWPVTIAIISVLVGWAGYSAVNDVGRGASGDADVKLGSGRMFDAVAKHYDRINKYMSLGLDKQWREFLVENLQLRPGDRLLDLATGTADVAIIAARGLQKLGSSGAVVGLDPSQGMLDVGQLKLEEQDLTGIVQLLHGDAQDMSALLPSDSFDKISMSFGIRNVEDRAAALREMHRVLRKSNESVVGILEFSLPTSGILKPVGHFMIRYGAPLIGWLVTGLKDEYMHLQRSILNFPEPPEFAKLMGTCGLDVFDIKETGFGAVSLYLARPKLA